MVAKMTFSDKPVLQICVIFYKNIISIVSRCLALPKVEDTLHLKSDLIINGQFFSFFFTLIV